MSINTLERDVARLLQEGQDAARRGDRAMARALLTQLVEQDPRNEEAWMWLSGVVTDADEQQICLENALVINPYNAHARKGLEFVLTKTGTPARVPLGPPAPVVSPVAVPVSASASALASQPPASAAQPEPLPGADAVVDVEQVIPLAAHAGDGAEPGDDAPDMPQSFALNTGGMLVDFEGEPFIPPGLEEMMQSPTSTGPTGNLLNATPDQIADELPNWLQELTPSAPAASNPQEEAPYSPFGMPDYSQPSNGAGMAAAGAMAAMPPVPAPAAPFGPVDFDDMGDFGMGVPSVNGGPVGPFSDTLMPDPHELPGGMDGFGAGTGNSSAQPWYLQGKGAPPPQGNGSAHLDSTMLKSSTLNSAMLTSAAMDELQRNKVVATMPCPNCETQVNETSLACAHCGYTFFVNCPFCHELIDTSEAVHSKIEPCPYCAKDVDRWKLGLGGVPDLISQKNPGSRPAGAGAGPDPAFPAMKQTLEINTERKKGLSFGWLVDLLWLIAIVAMVWALTQLPNWLHLSGQY